eukprot:TRINITY_DN9624_c0_g1_i4.p1 TRINITY_DN9624_c0_g1~~TRINITY_DN9624_c0_g1_i4.p1  ORF type:complete len:108 (+),score=21.95 TRINITY_DN9624_c0_g1_i4:267-590(+)
MNSATTDKIVQKSASASRVAKNTIAKDPKLGPLLMVVSGTVGAALSVTAMNFSRAKTRSHDMRKDIVSDATLEQTKEAAEEAADRFLRSVVYMPGYSDNFEQTDMLL